MPRFRDRHLLGKNKMGKLRLSMTRFNNCSQMLETLFLFPREDKLSLDKWGVF